jgi:hypothetical protein
MGFEDAYWSEVNADDSPLERAREDCELREWEQELEVDRLRREGEAADRASVLESP